MCIRPSQWWNLMTLRRNVLGIMQKGYTLNGRTICGDGDCSESKSLILLSY